MPWVPMAASWARRLRALAVATILQAMPPARGEDHTDYKYETYAEENGRILIRTHSALLERSLAPWLAFKGTFVYDGISGATPTGAPPPPGSTQVPLAEMKDIRRAFQLEPAFKWGEQKLMPQFSYSRESDYESSGLALNYLVNLHRRNTTLNLAAARTFDDVWGGRLHNRKQHKDLAEGLLGLSQVLTPSTLANVTLTIGTASGYLSDPYKGFRFLRYPDPKALFDDHRPGHRTKQIFSATVEHFFEPIDATGEFSYRFYHDSHEIFGHTATLEWFQKLGSHIVVAPVIRYYRQSAAYFYYVSFDADPSDTENPNQPRIPNFFSSDYRLSAFESWTYGVTATVTIRKNLALDFAYKRYEMLGLTRQTPASNYPKANVYTVGLRLLF